MSPNLGFAIGIEIGGLSIVLHTSDAEFAGIVERRYAGFRSDPARADARLDVTIVAPETFADQAGTELAVQLAGGCWLIRRGDFFAEWEPRSRAGAVTQSANPYSIDSVIRIVHSLMLAERGGFLLHSASAIRNRCAFLFSGLSGAGKTTITRLAPADAIRLSDEVSYIRRIGERYVAFGTPFSGELNAPGENASAPVEALYFLVQGGDNRVNPLPVATALRKLLRNILFFAEGEPAARVFQSACDFLAAVPAYELTFRPEAAVWKLVA
ncbi:MAG TPA: hypothetical protein VKS44_10540 [Candidatus Acidoferrales bacterium]|nr:hypothetical protein [Candidatus Acidoferrales bacterium]